MLFLFLFLLVVFMLIHGCMVIIRSFFYKVKINAILEDISTVEDLVYIRFKDFLNVTAEVFRRKGYNVSVTDKCGEEGRGLILNDIQFVEIWKHARSQLVDVETAMKLTKCMQSNSIYRGMIISLGDFKQSTRLFCHKNVIECINGEQLLEMFKEVQKRKDMLETSKG
ncbi:MAG: restriction endonuclease [Clostridia bacterium]|nr:restriction endonuclease [Clostridia bacterium]